MNIHSFRNCALALAVSSTALTACSNIDTGDATSIQAANETHPTDLDQINALEGTGEEHSKADVKPTAIDPIETRIQFAFDSSQLTDNARELLRSMLEQAKQQNISELSIAIEGHTDSIGTDAYNDRLSADRAASVKDYLQKQLETSAITWSIQTYGEDRPVASNSTPEGREKNRRADIEIKVKLMVASQ